MATAKKASKAKVALIATNGDFNPANFDINAPMTEEPAVTGEFPAIPNDDGSVSVQEAEAIFAERADVSSVETTSGTLHRDGTYSTVRKPSLDGLYK